MRTADENLAKALGMGANKYPSLNVNLIRGKRNFAQKSKFHGQIMEDGYIFNPYIHRRWVPVQYREIVPIINAFSMAEYLNKNRKHKYMIEFIINEVRKLHMLRMYDFTAYEERSKFFTIDVVKNILAFAVEKFLNAVQDRSLNYWNGKYSTYVFYYGTYYLKEEDVKVKNVLEPSLSGIVCKSVTSMQPFKDRINRIINKIKKADTYYEVLKAINECDFPLTHWAMDIDDSFVEPFQKTGAYYSIKNGIMFDNKEFMGVKGAEACKKLRELLDAGTTGKEFHDLYMKYIY